MSRCAPVMSVVAAPSVSAARDISGRRLWFHGLDMLEHLSGPIAWGLPNWPLDLATRPLRTADDAAP